MKQLFMKPVDTFFFRNQKDLLSGENSTAGTIFPPRPGTIYGALRSAYIHEHGGFESFYSAANSELKKWMGTPNEIGRFRLRGFAFYDGKEIFLPLPMDYQVVEESSDSKEEKWAYPLKLVKEDSPASNGNQYRLYGPKEEKSFSSSGAYIAYKDWKKNLFNPQAIRVAYASEWIIQEDKLGIKRDRKTRTSEEGMLYNIKMSRFLDNENRNKLGFIVFSPKDESPDFSQVKMMRLGGKNRPWILEQWESGFEILDSNEINQLIAAIQEREIARLILLSPTIWGNNSSFYDAKNKRICLGDGLDFDIITQASGRPTLTGGWDIARNKPKERVQALPAGTVFYLKVGKDKAQDLVNLLHKKVISDELGHEGYGWAICGPGLLVNI
jgi:CRISPR-associated protein Cmr3